MGEMLAGREGGREERGEWIFPRMQTVEHYGAGDFVDAVRGR